ncbi:hypothetical protein A9Q96_10085 [Rhodobacterales bacterium 52_120_T64]|nr:hypothetical protein A9Q96_10085 [Rhodobacterales bacterium 52_120_T64]
MKVIYGDIGKKTAGPNWANLGQIGTRLTHSKSRTLIYKGFSMVGNNIKVIANIHHNNKTNEQHLPSFAVSCVRCVLIFGPLGR